MIRHGKPWITEDDVEAVSHTLRSRFIGRCSKTAELEAILSRNVKSCVRCVSSGRAALVYALKGFEKVLIPTYSVEDLLQATVWAGGVPVPYDINGEAEGDIQIIVHGPTETSPFVPEVLHDFANVFPENFELGEDRAIFSFGPMKHITGGLGGGVAGIPFTEEMEHCSPMCDVNASLVLSQIRKRRMKRLLTVENFEEAKRHFFKHGIIVRHETGHLVHRLLGLPDKDFPNAVKRWNTTVSLPNYDLTDEEKERLEDACRRYSV